MTRNERSSLSLIFISGYTSLRICGMFSGHGCSPCVRVPVTLSLHEHIKTKSTKVYESHASENIEFTFENGGCGQNRTKRICEL